MIPPVLTGAFLKTGLCTARNECAIPTCDPNLINSSSVGFEFVFCQIIPDIIGNFRCVKRNAAQDFAHFAGVEREFILTITVTVEKIGIRVPENQGVDGGSHVAKRHPVDVTECKDRGDRGSFPGFRLHPAASAGAFRSELEKRNTEPHFSGCAAGVEWVRDPL